MKSTIFALTVASCAAFETSHKYNLEDPIVLQKVLDDGLMISDIPT